MRKLLIDNRLNDFHRIAESLKVLSVYSFCSVIWPPVTFQENFSQTFFSGHSESNDTGLEFVSYSGAESIAGHTDGQNKDIIYI
jgi:hypothetical protein